METEHKKKWMASMVAKHGSEAAVREFMRTSANKSKRNKGGTGGFHALDEAARQAIARKGGYARAKKIRAQKQQTVGGESPTENEDPTDGKDAGR